MAPRSARRRSAATEASCRPGAQETWARIPANGPAYALGLKAIAELQFVEASRLLDQAAREDRGDLYRVGVAASVLDIYAGKYDEAIAKATAAMKLQPREPVAMLQTAVALLNAGRVEEAAKFAYGAVRIQEKQGRTNTPQFADSLDALATALGFDEPHKDDAAADFLRAVAIRTHCAGAETPGNARTLNRLATLYDSQGRFREAEPLYLRALEIAHRIYGEESVNLRYA